MKTALAILIVVVAAASGQRPNVDPRQAAILQEARYLSGDGSFGAAYVQEDGTDFKEETSADGTRTGQYSYIDPNGKKITVMYTAGKNGFQVSGDHLPKAPAPLPVQAPQAPVPRYQQQPAVPQYNPQYNPAPVPQYNPAPQYNAIPNNGQAKQQFSYSFGTENGQSYFNQPQGSAFNNFNQNNFNNQYQQPQAYQAPTTTPAPAFFPPGKLSLNRSPDGFQYSFSSQ